MKVSLIQLEVSDREPYQSRIARVLDMIRGEKGRDLIVLPEMWAHGGFSYDGWGDGEALDGPILTAIAAAARDVGCFVHAGSIVERNPNGRPFNTSVLFSPSGERQAVYRKIHLFGFDEGEAVLFEPGREAVTTSTPFGVVGLATCFDLRFPELFRYMIPDGIEFVCIPSAWPIPRVGHWRVLMRARAIENQVYILGCATAGTHAGKTMGGHSAIVDPSGEVLVEASADREEILRADLSPAKIAAIRKEFPVLEWRRPQFQLGRKS
jgi:predicted amidohydrolase